MNTGIKPDQMPASSQRGEPISVGQTPGNPQSSSDRARRATLERNLLTQRLFDRFGAPNIYFFSMATLTARAPAPSAPQKDAMLAQARQLAAHTVTLHTGLAIDDIYAHPLIRRADIRSGHRMRAFLAAPIRGTARELIGVVAVADVVVRRWTSADIEAIQRIVAQFEALRLSQS
ncbi:GAF domain-containing protein [Roseobacter sinensis]|uniref:GAF domain-containing protein n=1 Tax=Roseobacter sinensis TaxID=2931391 RepID=A0ABT3BBA2_9RHOB|nr:GAF domain-containing protein [Roseobacter sp. WL0113]MCV3270856.1 GAF domain-containing protein [Roseobacter sp. WL0113]